MKSVENKNSTIFWVFILSGLIIIAIVPGLMALFMKFQIFNVASGGADGWLSFWGAYLGGIVGLIAIVVTTQFLISNQNKQNKEQISKQNQQHMELLQNQNKQHQEQIDEQRIAIERAAEINDQTERDRFFYSLLLKQNEEILDIFVSIFELNIKRFNCITDIANTKEAINVLRTILQEPEKELVDKPKVNERIGEQFNKVNMLIEKDVKLREELAARFTTLKIKSEYFPDHSNEVYDFCSLQQESVIDSVETIKEFIHENIISPDALRESVENLKKEFELEATSVMEHFRKGIMENLINFKKGS